MLISDFTGTYDYEKEEALQEAAFIIEEIADGHMSRDDAPACIEKIRIHWKKCLPDQEHFDDFDRHFIGSLKAAGVVP